MSEDQQAAPSPQKNAADAKRKNARIWLVISVSVSGIIMAWAFTLPFRSDTLSFADSDATENVFSEPGHEAINPVSSAEEFRAAAIALDEEFMRQVRERSAPKRVPGATEARAHWNRHVDSVKRELTRLGDPEKGTLEWEERQELIESLEDAPLGIETP